MSVSDLVYNWHAARADGDGVGGQWDVDRRGLCCMAGVSALGRP